MRSLRDQPPVKEPRIKAADRIIAAVE
jgi:hypothetical protein